MKTVFEHIRQRLYERKGIDLPKPVGTPKEIMEDVHAKWSELDAVVRLAKNRLLMGTLRYGMAKDQCHDKYDYGKQILVRYNRYVDTGNTELLIDILNYSALEFNYPHHPNAGFRPEDDGEHADPIK